MTETCSKCGQRIRKKPTPVERVRDRYTISVCSVVLTAISLVLSVLWSDQFLIATTFGIGATMLALIMLVHGFVNLTHTQQKEVWK